MMHPVYRLAGRSYFALFTPCTPLEWKRKAFSHNQPTSSDKEVMHLVLSPWTSTCASSQYLRQWQSQKNQHLPVSHSTVLPPKSTKRNHYMKLLQNSKVAFCFLGCWHSCQRSALKFTSAKCYIKQTFYYDFRYPDTVLVYNVF